MFNQTNWWEGNKFNMLPTPQYTPPALLDVEPSSENSAASQVPQLLRPDTINPNEQGVGTTDTSNAVENSGPFSSAMSDAFGKVSGAGLLGGAIGLAVGGPAGVMSGYSLGKNIEKAINGPSLGDMVNFGGGWHNAPTELGMTAHSAFGPSADPFGLNNASQVAYGGTYGGWGAPTADEIASMSQPNAMGGAVSQDVGPTDHLGRSSSVGGNSAHSQTTAGGIETIGDNAGQDSQSNCFITTATADHFGWSDDCRTLTVLRWFRDNVLAQSKDGVEDIKTYYEQAPEIARNMSADQCNRVWEKYLKKAISAIVSGNYPRAYKVYTAMFKELK